MLSESARVTTAEEYKFRIQYPNSKPRAVKVIALDSHSAALVDQLSKLKWNGAVFFSSLSFDAGDPAKGELKGWLNDIAGCTMDLLSEVASADSVVIISTAGEDARVANVISDACKANHKNLVGLIVPRPETDDEHISISLNHLRPCTTMLVLGGGIDYIEAMLTALRA